MKPYPAKLMQGTAVNRAVNSVKNDSEECIEPIEEPPLACRSIEQPAVPWCLWGVLSRLPSTLGGRFMADYWISFRIGAVANSDERHSALVEDVQGDLSRAFWGETTSFYLVESSQDIVTLTRRLASHLNPKHDTLLVRNLDRPDARYFGKVEYDPTLRRFMPYAKKL